MRTLSSRWFSALVIGWASGTATTPVASGTAFAFDFGDAFAFCNFRAFWAAAFTVAVLLAAAFGAIARKQLSSNDKPRTNCLCLSYLAGKKKQIKTLVLSLFQNMTHMSQLQKDTCNHIPHLMSTKNKKWQDALSGQGHSLGEVISSTVHHHVSKNFYVKGM